MGYVIFEGFGVGNDAENENDYFVDISARMNKEYYVVSYKEFSGVIKGPFTNSNINVRISPRQITPVNTQP
jgi:hypothetical protein